MRAAPIILAAGLLPLGAAASELDGKPVSETPVYEITGCDTPDAPRQGRIRTVEDYNESVERHDAYVDAVMDYLGCVQSEAQTDYDRISAAIHDAAAAELDSAQARIDTAKAALDEKREQFLEESGVR